MARSVDAPLESNFRRTPSYMLPDLNRSPYEDQVVGAGNPQPAGWVENADADTGDTTVRIDSSGLHIFDGKIFLEDYTGASVLGAAGFDGSWTQFLILGIYNGAFKAGALSSGLTAESEVGTGSTSADYAASLSSSIPYWVIDSVSGNVTYGITDDATYGRVFQITKSVAVGGTLSFYQDIPVGSDTDAFSIWLNMLLIPSEFGVAVTCKVYYSQRDSDHAIIGAEAGPLNTLTGSTATLDYSVYPYLANLFGVGVMDEDVRYVRLRLEVTLADTVSTHGSKFQLIQAQAKQRSLSPSLSMTPLRDTSASQVLDTLQSELTVLNLLVGENVGGPRRLEINGGGLTLTPSSGAFTLGWATTFGGTVDVELGRVAAGGLELAPSNGNDSILWVRSDAGQRSLLALRVDGDTNGRAVLSGDATAQGLFFGPGNAGQDTNLYRSAASELTTDDSLIVGTNLTVSGKHLGDLRIARSGDTYGAIQVGTSGTGDKLLIDWGSGGTNAARFGIYASAGFRLNVTMGVSGTSPTIGFYGGGAQAKQTVSGSRGGNAALASLLTALATIGLITNSSSA